MPPKKVAKPKSVEPTEPEKVVEPVKMDENLVYQFCMKWTHESNHDELTEEFKNSKWNYDEFFKIVNGNGWYETTMSKLAE